MNKEEQMHKVTEYYLLVQLIIVILVFLIIYQKEYVNEPIIVDPPSVTITYDPPDSLEDSWDTEYLVV